MQTDSNNPYSPPNLPDNASGAAPQGFQPNPSFSNSAFTNPAFTNPAFTNPGMGGFGGMQPHRGGLILGLGVASLATWLTGCISGVVMPPCSFVGLIGLGLGIAAWIMGNSDLRAMREGRMDQAGLSNTKAGKLCGMITVILVAIGVLLSIIMLVFFGAVFAALLGGAAAGAAAGGGVGP